MDELLAVPLTCLVILSKSCISCGSQFPHLQNRNKSLMLILNSEWWPIHITENNIIKKCYQDYVIT